VLGVDFACMYSYVLVRCSWCIGKFTFDLSARVSFRLSQFLASTPAETSTRTGLMPDLDIQCFGISANTAHDVRLPARIPWDRGPRSGASGPQSLCSIMCYFAAPRNSNCDMLTHRRGCLPPGPRPRPRLLAHALRCVSHR